MQTQSEFISRVTHEWCASHLLSKNIRSEGKKGPPEGSPKYYSVEWLDGFPLSASIN